MYFSRGNPVIYYGDEQGFVGDGGDQLARQDMFPSQVAEYNDDDLIGTDATTAESNFDPSHPLYRGDRAASPTVTREHPALRDGAQQHRFSTGGRGHLRVLAARPRARSASTSSRSTTPRRRRRRPSRPPPAGGAASRGSTASGAGARAPTPRGRLPVTVPPLSAVVYRSAGAIPRERGGAGDLA